MAKKLAEHHTFRKIVKAYFFMYGALEQILKSIPNHQDLIKNNKNIVQQAFYNASKYISKKRIYKFFNVSYDFIHYKTPVKCNNNILNTCLKKSNNQLTNPEIKNIQHYFATHKNWQKASVYWKMISDKTICFSKTTFYRNAQKLQINNVSKRKPWKNKTSITSSKPFEVLHMDVSYFCLNNFTAYLYLIIDNFSRKILAHQFNLELNSKISTHNLIQVFREYELSADDPTTLITDGGAENKGYVNRFINLECVPLVKKVAQSDISSSNSMIEAVIKQLKQYHLIIDPNDSFNKLTELIPKAIDEYNNKPLDVHNGYTPNQVFLVQSKAELPPLYTKAEITLAKTNRLKTNKDNRCASCK